MIDAGRHWETNSVFHPLQVFLPSISDSSSGDSIHLLWTERYLDAYARRANEILLRSDSALAIQFVYGLDTRQEAGAARRWDGIAIAPFLRIEGRFRDHWFATIETRATNHAPSLPHYSPVQRDISRVGFNTAEVDQSVIGYEDQWMTAAYGRTREIWGPMSEENLAPAGGSPAWEELRLEGRYKRFTYRYMCGFLEAIDTAGTSGVVQRYIIGRGIEYRNHRNLVIGVTELVVLAGENRPPDWAFFNPFGFEVEVEQNHRGNSRANSSRANAVWVSHLDYLPTPDLRLAGSILVDEFQFDQSDRKKGRVDLLGGLFHAAWTPIRRPAEITLLADWAHLGTYTMMHSYPWTVFDTRGQFIGNSIGNDADRYQIGCRAVFSVPIAVQASIGVRRWGDHSLLLHPYSTYVEILRTTFPSGAVRKNSFIEYQIDTMPASWLALSLSGHIDLQHSGLDSSLDAVRLSARLLFAHALSF